MKKFLMILLAFLAFSGIAFAAVNINTATQAELETLKGIGPVKAKAIIEHRTKHGPFKSVDDLANVEGIGKATVDQLRGELAVSGPTTVEKKEEKKPAAAKAEDKKGAKKEEAAKAEPKKEEKK